mmetsp:Transcript_26349/g.52906  ORF Transcript_26349/g.52906 Transcript_26349/m.52906 type:complete len:290 (+) Transcript_26349:549-1418(+)
MPLPVQLAEVGNVALNRRERAWHEQRALDAESDARTRLLAPGSTPRLELRRRAEHVEGGGGKLQPLARDAVVQHRLDNATRVKLTLLVLAQLHCACLNDAFAVSRQLAAVLEAVAPRVRIIRDLDLLLDVEHLVGAGARGHIAVDGLGLRVDKGEGGVVRRADSPVHAHDVGRVEAVAIAQHAWPLAKVFRKALEAKEHRLGSTACRARELDQRTVGKAALDHLAHENVHGEEGGVEHDHQAIVRLERKVVKHPQDHLLAKDAHEGLRAAVSLILEARPQAAKGHDDIH